MGDDDAMDYEEDDGSDAYEESDEEVEEVDEEEIPPPVARSSRPKPRFHTPSPRRRRQGNRAQLQVPAGSHKK